MHMNEAEWQATRLADLEAQIAAVEAELARASKPQPSKPKPARQTLSRRAKAQALVDWFVVDSLRDAYAYLEDMGE